MDAAQVMPHSGKESIRNPDLVMIWMCHDRDADPCVQRDCPSTRSTSAGQAGAECLLSAAELLHHKSAQQTE